MNRRTEPSPAPHAWRAIAICAAAAACGGAPAPSAPAPSSAAARGAIAFVGAGVVSTAGGGIAAAQTVIVEGDRIVRIGPAAEVPVPPGARVIEAAGHYLVPGFADMHVHLPDGATPGELERVLDLSLAQGVTLIRGMQGAPGQLEVRRRLRAEGAPAPELVLAGPPVARALTPDEARELVRAQHAAGYDLIKILGRLDRAAYDAIAAEAARLGIRVAGHVPKEIGLAAALEARQSSIEHVMGYVGAADDPAALDRLARETAARRIWNCPTLDFFAVGEAADDALLGRDGLAYATPAEREAWAAARRDGPPPPDAEARRARRHRIVAALARAGAPLLVGSDAPGTFAVPGFAYVEELRELARAGLRPAELLAAATRSAAAYLGRDDLGELAIGRRADLVLLARDPLARIDHVASPAGVMVRGIWLPRAELDRRIAKYRAP